MSVVLVPASVPAVSFVLPTTINGFSGWRDLPGLS
jgi:hypothetical protein